PERYNLLLSLQLFCEPVGKLLHHVFRNCISSKRGVFSHRTSLSRKKKMIQLRKDTHGHILVSCFSRRARKHPRLIGGHLSVKLALKNQYGLPDFADSR